MVTTPSGRPQTRSAPHDRASPVHDAQHPLVLQRERGVVVGAWVQWHRAHGSVVRANGERGGWGWGRREEEGSVVAGRRQDGTACSLQASSTARGKGWGCVRCKKKRVQEPGRGRGGRGKGSIAAVGHKLPPALAWPLFALHDAHSLAGIHEPTPAPSVRPPPAGTPGAPLPSFCPSAPQHT